MFCTNCGFSLQEEDKFCTRCGKPAGAAAAAAPGGPPPPPRRLVRVMSQKKIAGVCAGVAAYLEVDVTLVRVLWLVLTIGTGILFGLLIYVIGWIVMPKEYGAPAPGPVVATTPGGS